MRFTSIDSLGTVGLRWLNLKSTQIISHFKSIGKSLFFDTICSFIKYIKIIVRFFKAALVPFFPKIFFSIKQNTFALFQSFWENVSMKRAVTAEWYFLWNIYKIKALRFEVNLFFFKRRFVHKYFFNFDVVQKFLHLSGFLILKILKLCWLRK